MEDVIIREAPGVPGGAEVQARLLALAESCDDAIIATGLDGFITAWSHGAEEVYCYPAGEMLGKHIAVLYPESAAALVDEILEKVGRGERTDLIEGTRRRSDGTSVEVEVRVSPVFDDAGSVVGALSLARNIGDRRCREQEVRDSREYLERTQEIGHVGSWMTGIGPEALFTWTPETYRIFGIERDTPVRNIDFYNLLHPDDRPLLLETLIRVRASGTPAKMEVRFTRCDGATRWILLAADAQLNEVGVAVGMTGVVQDITERKEAESRVAYDALHDGLTGLPNGVLFLDRVALAVERCLRNESEIAVLCLHVDHYRLFSEIRGEECGDALLKQVADRLRAAVSATDSVACLRAGEYRLLCENVASSAAAAESAQRILAEVRKPFALNGGDALVTASIGIAMSKPGVRPEELVRDADLAMHRAKEQGRNCFELYDFRLRQQVNQRFALESDLRRALANNELFLEFQPIVSLAENRFIGAEALLRWKHPERGLIAPMEFIPAAEETGLIIPIGAWALEAACRQLRDWCDAAPGCGDWSMSVNVSALQLRAPDFADVVERALERAGLDATALCIEITESAVVDDGVVTDALRRLSGLGVRISIDDFGTKYSSLSYLSRLPIDELKIDQSFIQGLIGDGSERAIVSAILAIGRSLALGVTAEGIETQAQLTELHRLGCESGQGFYFAKPLPPHACLAILCRPSQEGNDAVCRW